MAIPALVLEDSTGKLVGSVQGFLDRGGSQLRPVVVLLDGTTPVPLYATPTTLSSTNRLYYTGMNCTGDTYVLAPGHEAYEMTASRYASAEGNRLYKGDGVVDSAVSLESYWDAAGSTLSCKNQSISLDAENASLVVDFDTLFTPPFELK